MDISCFACNPPTKWATDAEYRDHLVSFHGTTSPDEAIRLEKLKRKNSPVDLPPGISEVAAPTPEFAEMMKMVEKGPSTPPVGPPPPPQMKIEPKPLILKYKFDGNCPKCNNPVRTIVNEFEGKLIANAYCMFCDETILQVPVEKIPIKIDEIKQEKKIKNGRISIT